MIDASIPLRAQTFSLGDILNDIERRKSAESDRKYRQFQIDQAGRKQQQQIRLSELLPKATSGDQAAMRELSSIDPDLWRGLTNDQRKIGEERVKAIGEAALLADTPERWDMLVDQLSGRYPDLGQYRGKFSPALRASVIAEAGKASELIKQTTPDIRVIPDGGSLYEVPNPGVSTVWGGQPAPAAQPQPNVMPPGVPEDVSASNMTPEQAARIRASLGPKGQAAFDQWRARHGVQIAGQGGGDRATLEAEAEAAIARGADRQAVMARLRQMLGEQ